MKKLIVTAHPDDEVLWFSSVLMRDSPDIVCVTSGRDAIDSAVRKAAFEESMRILDLKNYRFLDYLDIKDERIDLELLSKQLAPYAKMGYDEVYTHGPFGDIHDSIHHQDVSFLVNQMFPNVLSTAWNLYPDLVNQLTKDEYLLKKYLIGTVYDKEYGLLRDAYEISSIEKFINLSPEASDIFYWAIANFGDNHDTLGRKYPDFWGFKSSPYELERHEMIRQLAKSAKPESILEFGACEGILSEKLAEIGDIEVTEKAPIYQRRLAEKGLSVIEEPDTSLYDTTVLAAFLEYIDDPGEFLQGVNSRFIVADVILDSELDKKIVDMLPDYRMVKEAQVRPRWEFMFHGDKKENLEIYRLGSHGYLFERK